MQLTPYVGETQVRSDSFSIVVDPRDQFRVDALAERARRITAISTPVQFAEAKAIAGKLRAVLDEIDDSKRMAERPFAAVKEAIKLKADEVARHAQAEHARILAMCSRHVAQIEAAEKAERERLAAEKKAELERLANAREQEHTNVKAAYCAMISTSNPEEIAKYRKLTLEASERSLDLALEQEAAQIGNGVRTYQPSKVPEGGVRHSFEFTLVDVKKLLAAGYLKLLRWQLDKLACNDCVKGMLAISPDTEPEIPGIVIERKTSVFVRPNA